MPNQVGQRVEAKRGYPRSAITNYNFADRTVPAHKRPGVEGGDLGTITRVEQLGSTVLWDSGVTGQFSYGNNITDTDKPKPEFKPVETTPQPVVFTDYREAKRFIDTTQEPHTSAASGMIRVGGELADSYTPKPDIPNIYVSITETNGSSAQLVLSTDNAEQVAVALFNQILYHRSLEGK